MVEVDKNLFELLKQCQSRMSGSKLVAGKRAMHALTSFSKPRKAPQRAPVRELDVMLAPAPKWSESNYIREHEKLLS